MPVPRQRWAVQRVFGPLTILCFGVVLVGADLAARIVVSGQSDSEAISEIIKFSNIVGIAMLAVPFLVADLLTVEVARNSPPRVAAVFFVVLIVALAALYLLGNWSSREALLHRKWTAAALAIGLLPLQSAPILVIALVVAEVLRRRYKHET